MRADGKLVKEGVSPIERVIPYIMPKRVDAQNYCTEYFDEEVIKDYIADMRREKGVHLNRMAVVIAAYHQAAIKHPYINRFVVGSKIYHRNHFCVSFVMMKKDEPAPAAPEAAPAAPKAVQQPVTAGKAKAKIDIILED